MSFGKRIWSRYRVRMPRTEQSPLLSFWRCIQVMQGVTKQVSGCGGVYSVSGVSWWSCGCRLWMSLLACSKSTNRKRTCEIDSFRTISCGIGKERTESFQCFSEYAQDTIKCGNFGYKWTITCVLVVQNTKKGTPWPLNAVITINVVRVDCAPYCRISCVSLFYVIDTDSTGPRARIKLTELGVTYLPFALSSDAQWLSYAYP